MTTMSSGIWLDVASLGILMVLFLIYQYRRDIPVRQNRLLLSMAKLTFVSTISDFVCGLIVDGTLPATNWGYYLAKGFLLVAQNATSVFYMLYVLEFVGVRYVEHQKILRVDLPFWVAAFLITLEVSNQSPCLLEGVPLWESDPVLLATYAITAYFIIVALATIVRSRKTLSVSTGVIMFSYVILAFAGPLLQAFEPNLRISSFTLTFSMLMMYLTIQNPEAIIDGVTGLLNKNAFNVICKNSIEMHKELDIVVLGIDDYVFFATLLDVESQKALLRKQAERMKRFEEMGELYRIDNDQFALVLHESDREHASSQISKMVLAFSQPMDNNGMKISLEGYGSLLRFPSDFQSSDMFFFLCAELRGNKADNNWADGSHEYSIKRLKQKDILRRQAVANLVKRLYPEKLMLRYHPIISVKSGKCTMMELDLDLFTPELGNILRSEYLPLAEKSNTAPLFNEFLLENACAILGSGKLEEQGISTLTVSLSSSQWLESGLVTKLRSLLASYHADPTKLYLHITANDKNSAPESVMETLQKVENLGVGIIIDEYGIGFNNIAREYRLEKIIVAISEEFLEQDKRKAGADVIIKNSVKLFSRFGYKTLMKGIQTSEDEAWCRDMGCDYLSGAYYGEDTLVSPGEARRV